MLQSIDLRAPAPKQQKLKRFLDNVRPVEFEKLDTLVAESFYGCNIPFHVADSIYFKKLLKALRPAYNPPHRRLLAGKLLDQTHDKIQKRNSELVAKMDNKATLLIDGWQNSSANQHNVVMMLATSDDQKVFLESYNFSTVRKTGENLSEAAEKAIALADERYNTKVTSALTDNASAMQKMGAHCTKLGILYSTCNAHSANLLAADILKSENYKKTIKKSEESSKRLPTNWFGKPFVRCRWQ